MPSPDLLHQIEADNIQKKDASECHLALLLLLPSALLGHVLPALRP